VRVLFSCVAAEGHFRPLLPLARAFRERGDVVAFATAPEFASVRQEGFDHLPAGIDQAELDRRHAPHRVRIFQMPFFERRATAFSTRFAHEDAPARLDDLLRVASEFGPDLLVHDSSELAGPAVASKLGVRSVHHSFGRPIPAVAVEAAAAVTPPMWEQLGLDPAPHAGLYRGPYVNIAPRSLATDMPLEAAEVLDLRPADRGPAERTDRPLVYITLGTTLPVKDFQLLLDALAGLDVDVLLTTGRSRDPATLDVPANARVEQFVPQSETLPRASLVVSHAGSGTLLGALAHGVPLVVTPHAADQFDNARAAAATGVARVVMPDELDEGAVRAAATAVLADPSYREAAERVADEIAAMPSPAEVAEVLAAR
jgi:UDP:flavonoid glycosyltransferase YjiC (YdhE family)